MRIKDETLIHHCSLPPEKDILYNIYPGESRFAELRRNIRRSFTISDRHCFTKLNFISNQAIIQERSKHLISHFYIIHPYSVFRQGWNNFMIAGYLYALIVTSYYGCLVSTRPDSHKRIVDSSIDVSQCFICLVDIVINICTGYVKNTPSKMVIVLSPGKIFIHYLSRLFLLDLITSLPLDHIVCLFGNQVSLFNYLPMVRLLKIVRFCTLRTYFYQATEQLNSSYVLRQILFYIITSFLVIHHCACYYTLISLALIETHDEVPWVASRNIFNSTMDNLYLMVFAHATFSITNLDHAVDPAHSIVDRVLSVLLSFFGSVLSCIVMGSFLQWTYIHVEAGRKYEEVEKQMEVFMRAKKLPRFLQERMVDFYEFRFQRSYFQESDILPMLSHSLREDILMHSCRRLVQNVSFFNDIPAPILVRIVSCMRREVFLVNDVIIKAGSKGNTMYFITSGTVAAFSPSGKEMCHLEDGAHFGEVALVVEGARRVSSVVAVENCDLQRLDRADYRREVAPYPDLATRIELIADKRLEMSVAQDRIHRRTFQAKRKSRLSQI